MKHPLHTPLAGALQSNPKVHLLGEAVDLSPATHGLMGRFPDRVHLLPAADAGLVGLATGMAFAGARPIVELAHPSALWGALQQLGQEAAAASGDFAAPVVLRVPLGPGQRPPMDVVAGVPGLTLAAASCAEEAAQLLAGALSARGPVVLFEPLVALTQSVDGLSPLGLDAARIRREGADVSLLAWGDGVHAALTAAEGLAAGGVDAEVVDVRVVSPLDLDTLAASVDKTGRPLFVGAPDVLLRAVTQRCFLRLESPPAHAAPEPDDIVAAVRRSLAY